MMTTQVFNSLNKPIKSRTIQDVRKAILKFFRTHGKSDLIVSENKPAINSIQVRRLTEDLGVQMYFTPANYSETNGVVERFHSTPCSTLVEIFRCIKGFRDKMSKPKRLDVIINSPGFVDGSCM